MYVQNNSLRKVAFWKYSLVFIIFGLSSKKLRMICKSLNRVVIAAFHTSSWTLCRQNVFFWRKVTIFWFKNGRWARTKRFFGKKLSNVNKTVFYLSTGTFEGFLTNSFCRFWSLSKGVWEFCWNWFQQGRQNKVYFSRGIFDVERFFFELLSSFQSLSVWSKNFWTFVRRTPNALSKLRYMCSKRSFDENVFRTCFFLIVLGPCAKIFWLSDRVFPAGLSKLELICPGELFKGSLFLWKKVIVFLVVRF